jgi:hypothetical protein
VESLKRGTARQDFQDAREFFRHLCALLERKSAEGSLQTEKILLLKS